MGGSSGWIDRKMSCLHCKVVHYKTDKSTLVESTAESYHGVEDFMTELAPRVRKACPYLTLGRYISRKMYYFLSSSWSGSGLFYTNTVLYTRACCSALLFQFSLISVCIPTLKTTSHKPKLQI